MTRMAIRGIGVVGGFGCGVDELAAAMQSGTSRIGSVAVPSGQGEVRLPAFRAETGRLEEFVPARTLRRIDHYSRLGLLGAHLALQDGGMPGGALGRLGVVIASGYGATGTTLAFLDGMVAGGDAGASPTHFANSVHSTAAANVSIVLGATGPTLTVSQFDLSVASALLSARQWLAEGRVDAVLLGAVDELSDLIGYLRHRRSPSPQGAVLPLAFDRDSSLPGEGAAFLLLTRHDDGDGYCAIDAVETGRDDGGPATVPADRLLLLGADGRSELGGRYRAALPADCRVACYAPLYGTMPAAAGFDLACAALILRQGAVFPMPGAAGCDLAGKPTALETDRICALRFAGAREFARIELSCIASAAPPSPLRSLRERG